jgi:tetratricopeptide (TPR) repeat protein
MSLLLEALKKAELAKQSAQQAPAEPLSLQSEARREPVITRENLPNISQSLSILAEDLPSATAQDASVEEPEPSPVPTSGLRIELQPQEPPVAEPETTTARAQPELQAEREAARQLFEAKEVDYNPRRPFYITIGVLVACAVGYGVYLWWQLQPHYAVNTAAIQNAPKAPPAAGQPAGELAAAPASAPAAVETATTSRPANADAAKQTALATAGSLSSAPASPAPPTGPTFVRQGSREATAPASRAAATQAATRASPRVAQAAAASQLPIAVTPATAQADAVLERAFASYQRGDLEGARAGYERVIAREPNDRDALLGLAAVDIRSGNFDTALMRYLRMLELDPLDAYAHAGVIALQGSADPVQYESRIKTLIARLPDATNLYFSLGNQYAAQNRWPEAQSAYFKAFSGEPDNPDYAFNLAVSLDHLHQPKLALEHYQKALALAGRRPAAFGQAQAEARARELER